MSWYWAILWFIGVLMFLVFIHELGHFVTAKWRGVKVLEFGIGMPPRIWGKQYGETMYSVNWIPIGGFCKMLGEEDPSEPGSLASKGAGTRLLVLGAGSLVMLIFPIILYSSIYMFPHDFTMGWEEQIEIVDIEPGTPADAAGLQVGDQILAIDDVPILYAEKLKELTKDNLGEEVRLTVLRDEQKVNVSLIPRETYPDDEGPLGITIRPQLVIVKEIKRVEEGSPAETAGFHRGDKILSINGIPILTETDYQDAMADAPGQETLFTVLRDEEKIAISVVPRVEYPEGEGPLGVSIKNNGIRIKEHKYYLPWTAIGKGLEMNKDIYVALKDSLNQITFDQMGGVVAAGDVTVEIAEQGNWEDLTLWAGLLSINLGIINLFPIPALDGGRIVFVLLEIIRRGKRVSPETEGKIHLAGFAMVIAFIIFITYQDIGRIISGESFLP